MNIDYLKLGEIKEISKLLNNNQSMTLDEQLGEKVIIRTYSAGVWFGTLSKKLGNEVILENARRMYYWKCVKSISLSSIAKYGVDQEESKITNAVHKVWLEAIEIISLSKKSIESIEGTEDAVAE